jgi:nitrile hydratase subunit beta
MSHRHRRTPRELLETVGLNADHMRRYPHEFSKADVFLLADRQRFQRGDVVRVKNEHFDGYIRMPGYIRGKTGIVVSESPSYPFPDAHGHGVEAVDEPTYDVRFRSEDLWPNSTDSALVHVGVFQSYLERV